MTKTRLTEEQLNVVLQKHSLWLIDPTKGERADLSGANLRGANLSDANLRDASTQGSRGLTILSVESRLEFPKSQKQL